MWSRFEDAARDDTLGLSNGTMELPEGTDADIFYELTIGSQPQLKLPVNPDWMRLGECYDWIKAQVLRDVKRRVRLIIFVVFSPLFQWTKYIRVVRFRIGESLQFIIVFI